MTVKPHMKQSIPATMTAVVLTGHGDFDRLEVRHDWPTPSPSTGEVLIRVAACGLNNTDVNTRTAWYSKGVEENTTGGAFDSASDDDATWGGAPLTFPRIQGADVCGKVVAVGDGADSTLIGKRVMLETWIRDWKNPMNLDAITYFGSECDGGFAHYTKIDQRYVHPIESDLSDPEIASFATSYVTAENMLNRAAVGSGDTVLVPGASGGVGGALIQLAKRRGATVVGLASDAKHAAMALTKTKLLDPAGGGGVAASAV